MRAELADWRCVARNPRIDFGGNLGAHAKLGVENEFAEDLQGEIIRDLSVH